MLSIGRNALKIVLPRCHNERLITSSIIKKLNLNEFDNVNEPILTYEKNSKERLALEHQLKLTSSKCEDIPIMINGIEYKTNMICEQSMPHNHQHKIAKFYYADVKLIEMAIKVTVEQQKQWDRTSLNDRIEIWLKAADLMAGKYRQELNAATMLGQSKTVIQAEIDASAELIDFIRMNAYFLKESTKYQPISENINVTKNSMRYRGIDGFIAAISPFNFTAIGGNLAYTPALMGNGVLWKPSDTAILSNYIIYKIMLEAGLPPGVVSFIPSDGPIFGNTITSSEHFSGLNFTGSVPTFNHLWRQVGNNINLYKNFPRLIGECGGKNFHFIHPSADCETVITSTIRSAFEYCGQKCSACSRMYVPSSLWSTIRNGLIEKQKMLKINDVCDFKSFASAVIDKKAFDRIVSYIELAKNDENLEIIAGGKYSDEIGYFIDPTIVVSNDPLHKIMCEEIFGPVLSIYVYNDNDIVNCMDIVNTSTKFALTGAVFAQDKEFLHTAMDKFKMAAGNFYINDKSTGSVVGQQPFGGGRMSGTNDKAGGPHYILRWTSPQSIKETFVPLRDIDYPYMR